MTHNQVTVLMTIGGGILLLFLAALVLLSKGATEHEIARRISNLREGSAPARSRSSRFLPALVALMRRIGSGMRDKMMSAKDADALAKSLAAAGLEPSKALPIFIGAKLACLILIPMVTWLGTVLLGCSTGKQILGTAASVAVAMLLPNWVIGLIRRPYQAALRRGIPDALDLMVVCAEAGLGLESAVERVTHEMKLSNRPVSVEFSLLMHEMRIYPDRRVALDNLAERTGQLSLKRLAATIMQTLKYGTPLSQGLRTLAAEMRNERLIQFEERAGKLPALLVMPMMLFILPCLFIIIMGKPAAQIIDVFTSMNH
jgi:tight adherence protein C